MKRSFPVSDVSASAGSACPDFSARPGEINFVYQPRSLDNFLKRFCIIRL